MGLDPLAWLAGLRRRVARVQGMLATGYPPIAASRNSTRTRPQIAVLRQPWLAAENVQHQRPISGFERQLLLP
jgi:hypothetical protein